MATGTITKTRKSIVVHYPLNDISVSTAWGSLYMRALSIPISVSGTISGAIVSYKGSSDLAIVSIDSLSNTVANILLVRGTSSPGLNGTITLEVFYE